MNFNEISEILGIKIIIAIVMSFALTRFIIPLVVKVAHAKSMYAVPNRRSSHKRTIPNIGGVGIFLGFMVTSLLLANGEEIIKLQYILLGALIIFLVGFTDDLIVLAPLTKLSGQFLAAAIVCLVGGLDFKYLEVFGTGELPQWLSGTIAVFSVVFLMNAINLIDGIDGLAASLGASIMCFFGAWFWLNGLHNWAIIAMAYMAALLAFLPFNVYNWKEKLFMGDNGSMLLGFMTSIFVIHFINLHAQSYELEYPFAAPTSIALATVFVPIVDMFHVFILRMYRGKSPFSADKEHIHHNLLTLGCSHVQATALITLFNIIILFFAIFLSNFIPSTWELIVLIVLAIVLRQIPFFLIQRKKIMVRKRK